MIPAAVTDIEPFDSFEGVAGESLKFPIFQRGREDQRHQSRCLHYSAVPVGLRVEGVSREKQVVTEYPHTDAGAGGGNHSSLGLSDDLLYLPEKPVPAIVGTATGVPGASRDRYRTATDVSERE